MLRYRSKMYKKERKMKKVVKKRVAAAVLAVFFAAILLATLGGCSMEQKIVGNWVYIGDDYESSFYEKTVDYQFSIRFYKGHDGRWYGENMAWQLNGNSLTIKTEYGTSLFNRTTYTHTYRIEIKGDRLYLYDDNGPVYQVGIAKVFKKY